MANRKLILCVFIDAFGWEIARKHPFLDELLPLKKPMETVFGYSSTCDPTILTGKLPREHGHFAFFNYDPEHSPFAASRWLGLLPNAVTRRGRVRRVMSRVLKRAYGYTGYFQLYNMPFRHLPLFDYSEKRDLYQPGGINTGLPTIFDFMRQEQIPYHCSEWWRGEADNFAALSAQIERGEIAFAYLYLAALDGILHAEGTQAPQVRAKIAGYDADLRRLITLAREHYDEVNLHIFSDHGMTDVTQTCDLKARIDACGLRFGTDYAVAYDSTMARFWFPRGSARAPIEDALRQEPLGRILDAATLEAWGCDFPGQKYGELFFLMNPGVLLCPSFMGETRLKGMHGYEPTDRHSRAFYASNVVAENAPAHLTDLYCLMRNEIER